METNFDQLKYNVEGQSDFSLTEALRLYKAKYPEFGDFHKDVVKINNPMLVEFGKFVSEVWDSIEPVTTQEALAQPNNETRRVYFSCIGVQKLFKDLDPKLLDAQTINKKRWGWDKDNNKVMNLFNDVYELYEIEGKKMFERDRWNNEPNPIYAVRCWCTTTGREYWIYVPMEAAIGIRWFGGTQNVNPDAIRAIAWTIRIDIKNPQSIYRQGDIIVVEMPDNPEECEERHITKEEYLNLMYSES